MTQDYSTPRCYSYIRFSTPEQIKGNSLARQLKLSREYAQENGLVLDESLSLKDLGLSAYSGAHRKRGALGEFLKLVREGKIPKNSILLVESLDRLSRQEIMEALGQFQQIIMSDIKIVTLSDKLEYQKDSLNNNIGNLIIGLTIMSRAYEESLEKSKRIRSAWKTKREEVGEKKLTARAPAWLRLDDKKDLFIEITERVAIIKRIFDLSLHGIGTGSIAKKLNSEKIPAWKSKTGWHQSYVSKILHNKAVLGEFEPHFMKKDEEKGKLVREPSGKVTANYFPRIISDEVFYRVQERLKSNKNLGGKNGKLGNLFGGLAKCGYCGAPMQFVNKGKRPNSGNYLVCDNARRGLKCEYNSYSYQEFEDAALSFCAGLKISDVLTEDAVHIESKVAELQGRLAVLSNEYGGLERGVRNLVMSLSKEDDKNTQLSIKEGIAEFNNRRDEITREKTEIMQQITELTYKQQSLESSIEGVKELKEFAQTVPQDKLVEVRQKLRGELRQLIAKIDVFPVGMALSAETLKNLADMELTQDKINNYVKGLKDRKKRYFIIYFRNGDFRMLVPSTEDPKTYHVWIDKEQNKYGMMDKKLTDEGLVSEKRYIQV